MKHTRKLLLCAFMVPFDFAALAIGLFEPDILPCGALVGTHASAEFVLAVAMELITIAAIPLALKMFKFNAVASRLTSPKALCRFGLMRLALLGVPMMVNILLYYLFMNVAFGYLAIITALCMAFVYPSKDRCAAEISADLIE